jgi:UDP-glucuronate 4-epimerase
MGRRRVAEPVGGATGPAPTEERFLVTGALGCIGAWTVRTLAREGVPVVAFDASPDPRRLRQITTSEDLATVDVVKGDITDLASVERALDDHRITNVIHLAALQVPASRADPPLGARVNVVGTVNVFEAVRRRSDRIRQLVYTGSIGMFDAADADPTTHRLEAQATPHPTNHYGVYKQANEGTAHVYWLENGISSIGLRPLTVYGPGRDQGMTSTPTKAILAAILGRPYTISFGGRTLFQFAEDVAHALIVASRSTLEGATVFNLGGSLALVSEFAAAIADAVPGSAGLVDFVDQPLPFPEEISADELTALGPIPVTPLVDGVQRTADFFRELKEDGRLVPEEHGLEPVAGGRPALANR